MSGLAFSLAIVLLLIIDRSINYSEIQKINVANSAYGLIENFSLPIDQPSIQTVISEGKTDPLGKCRINAEKTVTITSTNHTIRQIKTPILIYHYIEDPGSSTLPYLFTNTDIFEAQLKTLKNNCYETFFVRELAEAILGDRELPKKNITLTFDDGYADWYYNALPLLKKYEVKATMFVIVNAINKPGYLTQEQMIEMIDSGYVEFGSHTLNHANVRDSSWEVARSEIIESKSKLENIIGRPVYNFAYPYGFKNYREESLCQKAGYLTCASTWPGDVQSIKRRYNLYRLNPFHRIDDELISWLEQVDHLKMKY